MKPHSNQEKRLAVPLNRKVLCCLVVGWAAFFSTTVFAATNHWSGASCQAAAVGSCDWSDAQNWLEQSAPKRTDGSADLIFATAVSQTPNVLVCSRVNASSIALRSRPSVWRKWT